MIVRIARTVYRRLRRRQRLFNRYLWLLLLLLVTCLPYFWWYGYDVQDTTTAELLETTQETVTDAMPDLHEFGIPFFVKQQPYNCSAVLYNTTSWEAQQADEARDAAAITEYKLFKTLRKSCRYIQSKFYWPREPLSKQERAFPLAYVLPVYADTEHVIALLNAIFAPQNIYYIAVDVKAHQLTHKNIEFFIKCMNEMGFNNIKLFDRIYSILRFHISFLDPVYDMITELVSSDHEWKYVITIYNHQFPLKTNAEIVQILKLHEGISSVMIYSTGLRDRLNTELFVRRDEFGLPMDVSGRRIVLEEEEEELLKQEPAKIDGITVFKGLTSVSLSRQLADFMATDSRALQLYKSLRRTRGPDEHFFNTLFAAPELNAPGGYPGSCFLKCNNTKIEQLTRFSIWKSQKSRMTTYCKSKDVRHDICMISPVMLPFLVRRREFFADKFLTHQKSRGFVARECLREVIFNRTYYGGGLGAVHENVYRNLPSIRYGRYLISGKTPEMFNCRCLPRITVNKFSNLDEARKFIKPVKILRKERLLKHHRKQRVETTTEALGEQTTTEKDSDDDVVPTERQHIDY